MPSGSAEPVSYSRIASPPSTALCRSRVTSRAHPAEVGSGAPNACVQLGGGLADRITRGCGPRLRIGRGGLLARSDVPGGGVRSARRRRERRGACDRTAAGRGRSSRQCARRGVLPRVEARARDGRGRHRAHARARGARARTARRADAARHARAGRGIRSLRGPAGQAIQRRRWNAARGLRRTDAGEQAARRARALRRPASARVGHARAGARTRRRQARGAGGARHDHVDHRRADRDPARCGHRARGLGRRTRARRGTRDRNPPGGGAGRHHPARDRGADQRSARRTARAARRRQGPQLRRVRTRPRPRSRARRRRASR